MWHALSLSASQQLFGPVRFRADARIALENPVFATDGTAAGLAQVGPELTRSVPSARPSPLYCQKRVRTYKSLLGWATVNGMPRYVPGK